MVMPRSRSKSLLSNTWLLRFCPSRNRLPANIILSTSVVLPWSTWAIIAMFLMSCISFSISCYALRGFCLRFCGCKITHFILYSLWFSVLFLSVSHLICPLQILWYALSAFRYTPFCLTAWCESDGFSSCPAARSPHSWNCIFMQSRPFIIPVRNLLFIRMLEMAFQKCHFYTPKGELLGAKSATFRTQKWHFWKAKVQPYIYTPFFVCLYRVGFTISAGWVGLFLRLISRGILRNSEFWNK